MSVLTLQVDEVMRTLSNDGQYPFVENDKNVDIIRFALLTGFADIALDEHSALRVMYQRPGETEVRAQTLTYYDTDGLHNYYDWHLAQSDLAKNGSLMVALCILDISGGEVSEWHTTPCAVRVLSTIHTDDSDEGDDTITPTVRERVAVLESMIQRVASGAPVVVSSTSAMTDTEQIYVLSTDGMWYYHDGSAWVQGGVYGALTIADGSLTGAKLANGTIPTAKIADGAVTGAKLANGTVTADKIASGVVPPVDEVNTLEDITIRQLSPIAFSPNLTKGQYIRLSDGRKYTSSGYARTTNLWCGAGQRYAISVTNPAYEFNLMFYNQNGDLNNGSGYIKGTNYTINDVIIIPSYAVYFGMNFRRVDEQEITDDDINAIRNSILCFVLTDKTLTQEDKAADAKTVGDEISALKNTYSVDKASGTIIDYYIGIDEGTIKRSAQTVKTVYFSCLPNAYYMLEHGLAGVFVVACYDRVPVLNLNATKFVNDKGRARTIFKTDSTAQYLAVYYYSSKFNSETPEEVFDSLEIKSVGFDSIINFMVDTENKDEVVIVDHDFYTSGDGVSVAATFDDVIELYDELATSYPEYVTKNTLTSGTLVNYEYVFTTGDYNAKNGRRNQEPRIEKPVILLLSGIHGYERSAVMSLYTVMKHMCENNYELADVIGYATIKVIPVGDPWSYTNNSRVNANGVNINRNFDAPEWESDGEGTIDYSGAEPADQDETQIIQNWILANSDAILFIDFHNSVYTNEISCLLSDNLAHQSDYKRKYLLGMNKIIPYFIKGKGITDESTIYCYTGGSRSYNDRARQAVSYAYRHGIEDAFVHESSWNVNHTGKHSKISIGTGAEVIGNMLIAFKSYYENIEIIPWTPE